MKVISAEEMRRVEDLAYKSYGEFYSDIFMERAGKEVAWHAKDLFRTRQLKKANAVIYLLCAKGNNSGDAYVCGRYLLNAGFTVVAWQIVPIEQASPLWQKNYHLFVENGGKVASPEVTKFSFAQDGVIVDGLLGTGFKGSLASNYQAVIEQANETRLPIVAIDVPSGLDASRGLIAEKGVGSQKQAINATRTVFLGLPKTGYFLGQGWDRVGELAYGDFGLQPEFVEKAQEEFTFVSTELVRPWLPPLRPSRHKYEAGSVFALAGSQGMAGAALLSCHAALRSGSGIVFLSSPEKMRQELVCSPYEIIKISYPDELIQDTQAGEDARKAWLERSERASACLVGPGLSRAPEVGTLIRKLVPQISVPTVLDADALNHYAEEPFPLPSATIMTPHLGELQRLLAREQRLLVDNSLLQTCQKFVEERRVTLILKGGVTFIFHPGETIAVSTLGNPGMATAGSGDVLTGILAGLLAQGLSTYKAALLGVALHGLAGKHARKVKTDYCTIASDLIEFLPFAFKELLTAA